MIAARASHLEPGDRVHVTGHAKPVTVVCVSLRGDGDAIVTYCADGGWVKRSRRIPCDRLMRLADAPSPSPEQAYQDARNLARVARVVAS